MSGDDGVRDEIRFFTSLLILLTDRLDLSTGVYLRVVCVLFHHFSSEIPMVDRSNQSSLPSALFISISISISIFSSSASRHFSK